MCEKNAPTVQHHLKVHILANPFKQPSTFAKSPSSLETWLLAHYPQSSSGAEASGEEGEAGWRRCPLAEASEAPGEGELACRRACGAAREQEEAGAGWPCWHEAEASGEEVGAGQLRYREAEACLGSREAAVVGWLHCP